jgi:hypothetical protein
MIIPAQATIVPDFDSAVKLARYAQVLGYSECQILGVNNPDDTQYECRDIWVKWQRDMVLKYLAEAQLEIEQVVGYPLEARWIADDRRSYKQPVLSYWKKVIEAGVKASTDISLGEAVSHVTDPAVVGPVATTVTEEDEIRVFYPSAQTDGEVEVHPSDIDISGGNVTIYVPRCRMVLASLVDNEATGIDYTDTTNFLQTVDIKRKYNDPSTNAELIWPNSCGCGISGCATCSETTQDACMQILDEEIGNWSVLPAEYSGGSWSTSVTACCAGYPRYVKLNYKAGLESLTKQAEDAIIRLANTKMPEDPCGCETAQRLWREDRQRPDPTTVPRLNNPFGMSNGAWAAWKYAQAMKVFRAGVL